MKRAFLFLLAAMLSGCAGMEAPKSPVVHPVQIGSETIYYAFWCDMEAWGISHKGCDRFQVGKDGRVTLIRGDTASGPGSLQGIAQTAVGSTGNAAAVAGIFGVLK